MALELLTSTEAKATGAGQQVDGRGGNGSRSSSTKTITELHEQAPAALKALYTELETFILELGDDIIKKVTKNYYAFRRLKNFACVEVHPQSQKLLVYVKSAVEHVTEQPGFTRDVTNIGHFGTGDLEIVLASPEDLDRAKPLIQASYEAN